MRATRRALLVMWIEAFNWFVETDRLMRRHQAGLVTWDEFRAAREQG